MRAVIDTNIIVSAALFSNSLPRKSLDHVLDHGVILVSESILLELIEVLCRSKFNKYLLEDERMKFLIDFLSETEFVEIKDSITECRDPKDNKFLELAISGQADYIISGDQDLLALHPFRNVRICNPKDFLDQITAK